MVNELPAHAFALVEPLYCNPKSMSQGARNLKAADPNPWRVQHTKSSSLNWVDTSISVSTSPLSISIYTLWK